MLDAARIYRSEGGNPPAAVPDCTGGGGATPDPCVTGRSYVEIGGSTYIRLTVLSSTASRWNSASPSPTSIAVTDRGYIPSDATISLSPGVADWSFTGAGSHSVTESSKLGPNRSPLFDSGPATTGHFAFRFFAAGTYAYESTVKKDKARGSVGIPVLVTPAAGHPDTRFTVIWARNPPPGYTFDIRVRFRPRGSKNWKGWATWKDTTSGTEALLVPAYGKGTYEVEARLRSTATHRVSDYSPETTVEVS